MKRLGLLLLLLAPLEVMGQTPVVSVLARTAAYTDSTGQVWNPIGTQCKTPKQYTMNPVQAITGTLPGPTDQNLYNAQWYGSMTCTFPVPAGNYTVLFKFAEIYYGTTAGGPCTPANCAGQRIFNVSLNGVSVLLNFDIAASAGGSLKAIDKSFTTAATSNGITIAFTPTASSPDPNPQWDAIQITPVNTPPPPTASGLTLSGTNATGTPVSQTFDPSKPISATFLQTGGFQVIGGTVVPLTVTTIAPGSGQAAAAVSLTGTGFVSTGMTGGLICPSGASGTYYPFATLTYVNSTHLNAVVPTIPGTLPVTCDLQVTVP